MVTRTEQWGRCRRSVVVLSVCVLLGGTLSGLARADAKTDALACTALGMGSAARSAALCRDLGRVLGRPVQVLEEGRKALRAALHIVRGDVDWLVVWLEQGKARAFTRVSSADASGREALFLARAARVLMREAKLRDAAEKTHEAGCIRVEANGGVPMRAFDLAYPWADLKRCKLHVVDVVDPWWDAKAEHDGTFEKSAQARGPASVQERQARDPKGY